MHRSPLSILNYNGSLIGSYLASPTNRFFHFAKVLIVQGVGVWQISADEHMQDAIGLQSIDVTLEISQTLQNDPSPSSNLQCDVLQLTSVPGLAFLNRVIDFGSAHDRTHLSVRLFFPRRESYVSWAEAFEKRMTDCPAVDLSFSSLEPLQWLRAIPAAEPNDTLEKIFTNAVAGLLLRSTPSSLERDIRSLDSHLLQRLSLPWLSTTPVCRKTVAIIEGGFNYDFRQRMLENACALGINVVILDKETHWLNLPGYQHLRHAFLAIDMTLDSDLPHRIVHTLKTSGIPVNGLTSFSDSYLVATAKAAEILQFPTSPSVSLEKTVDKYKCRRYLSNQPTTICCTDEEDFREQRSKISTELSFPLIVKPTKGGGSQGVVKVRDEQELCFTMSQTSKRTGESIIIEPYVDGPEIDVNFVLHRGEILFCELSDGFPCAGDLPNADISDSFLETRLIIPSALDQCEIDLAKRYLHKVLLDLGFSSGVFHVEARIKNSSQHYAMGEDGILDLRHITSHSNSVAEVFLLEVNARCPGREALSAVAHCYGIDYCMMQLLLAVDDSPRAIALCKPFLHGCQYQGCEAVYVPAGAGGIFKHGDLKDELLKGQPDLANDIVEHHTLFQKGDVISGPETGKLRWAATFIVASRESRQDALMAGERVQREFQYQSFT